MGGDYTPSELAPMLPDVESSMYELDVGEDVKHLVKDLKRREVVEWAVQEVHDLTVDITLVVRSKSKVHAGRLLRDTVRTSRCRDSFEVDDDFDDAQLPLTLEIRLSNSFSWLTHKSVSLQ